MYRQRGPATVSQLRQELQTSRRVLVPLLEKLDREGATRRVGDQRILAH
jgi:selenocysteine-specific elongation factor